MFQLRQEVITRLDGLGEQMRRAVAAASLAQSVATLSAGRPHSGGGSGGGGRAMVGRTESSRLRRRQWSYGHLSTQ